MEWLQEGGLILGAFEEAGYDQARVSLGIGDLMLFYTDGAVEAIGSDGTEFGIDRLVAILQRCSHERASQIRIALEEEILRHCEGKAQDDVTLVVLKVDTEIGDMESGGSGG